MTRLRGIYAILNDDASLLALAHAAVDASVRVVQYRAKVGIHAERLRALRALTRERGALLIVNDDWRAALAFECDGVHLGPDDDGFADAAPVRAAVGSARLIGLSCGSVGEAIAATRAGADYIGVGSVYATSSKSDAGAPIGIEGLMRVAAATALPVAAIGGITIENLTGVAQTGVAMAAVISALSGADDPRAAAQALVRTWEAARA